MQTSDRKQEKLRALRTDALALARAGKHRAALEKFSRLESHENDGEWPRRAAECHQALGNEPERLAALGRAADCYVRAGMVAKAMAVCKLILASDPRHPAALSWMSKLESPAPKQERPPTRVLPERPLPDRAADASQPAPNSARKLVAEQGLVAVAREVARRAARKREASLEPGAADVAPMGPAGTVPPPSSGSWQAVDDAELLDGDEVSSLVDGERRSEAESAAGQVRDPELFEAEIKVLPTLTLPPLSADSPQLRSLVPGSIALPSQNGRPSGMFRLAIDGEKLQREEETLRQAHELLPAIPFFSELDPKTLQGLVRQSRLLHLQPGECIFKQGDPPDSLYVVVNGEVRVIEEGASRVELYSLGENEFFGESALISNESQSTTVEASQACDLLAFDREAMRSCIHDSPAVIPVLLRFLRERMIEHMVHVSPLLTGFDTAERRALTRRFEFIEFGQGSQLIQQGARSPGLFVLLSGAVDVVCGQADRTILLSTLERGGVFGEMSLLGRPAAVADVRGARPGFALMLPVAGFREVIMTHPQFLEVVTTLCEERREANTRLLVPSAARH